MKIPEQLQNTGRSCRFRDTTPLLRCYRLINADTLEDIVDVRLYWGKGVICRCAMWLHDRRRGHGIYLGVGSAGGYGYDKPSQAAQSAFNDLKINLEEYRCGCVGSAAVETAVEAVGRVLDPGHKTHLIKFYP